MKHARGRLEGEPPTCVEKSPPDGHNARLMSLEIAAATDIGLRRSQNEDRHAWWLSESDPGHAVIVVADGMGGARAGEVASQLTVDHVLEGARALGSAPTVEGLRAVIEGANRTVHDDSIAHPDRRGMGTTCTVVVVSGAHAWFAHVGDSRAYVVREGAIQQITRDHSLVAQLVEFNHLTPEEAKSDPRRNVVTRSVGVAPTVEVDGGEAVLRPGDTLLVSTDGLHGLVDDAELAAAASADLGRGCRELIELAKIRGGHDNITLVLARLAESGDGRASA